MLVKLSWYKLGRYDLTLCNMHYPTLVKQATWISEIKKKKYYTLKHIYIYTFALFFLFTLASYLYINVVIPNCPYSNPLLVIQRSNIKTRTLTKKNYINNNIHTYIIRKYFFCVKNVRQIVYIWQSMTNMLCQICTYYTHIPVTL